MMKQKYSRLVTTAAWAATIIATLLLIAKIVVWWQTSSVSILASVIDSLLDIGASVINLIVLKYALQPADREHTFGHGKAESLAAIGQGMFIIGSAVFLLLNGIERLSTPQALISPQYGVYVCVFSIVLTLGLVRFQRYVVKQTGSQAISADSIHYQSDLILNIAILIAMLLSWTGILWADAVFAIGISLYIFYSAVKMIYEAIQTLLDRQLPTEDLQQIKDICLSVDGVLGMHQLRTRVSGPTKFIQLHIELEDFLPLIEAHNISDIVEEKLLSAFPDADIIIHQDPYSVAETFELKQKQTDWF